MVKPWTVVDFILIWLGGFLGAGVVSVIGLALERDDLTLLLALVGQYIGILGGVWLLKARGDKEELGFKIEPGDALYMGLGLVLNVTLVLLFIPITQLLFPDGPPQQEVAQFLGGDEIGTLVKLALIVSLILFSPIIEELVFRGALLRALARRGQRVAIVGTAFLFAVVHIFDRGFESSQIWRSAAVVLPPIFLLGLALAWVTMRRGRLGPAIFMHSGFNLLATVVLLIPTEVLEGL